MFVPEDKSVELNTLLQCKTENLGVIWEGNVFENIHWKDKKRD